MNLIEYEGDRTLRRISRFISIYVVFTAGISLIPTVFALAAVTEPSGLALAAALGGIALYGYGAAGLMFFALGKIWKRRHDATRWTKLAMVFALPGSGLTGLVALLFVVSMVGDGGLIGVAFGIVGLAVLAGSILNVVVLIRVLRTDLEAVLWANESEQRALDESLNFIE